MLDAITLIHVLFGTAAFLGALGAVCAQTVYRSQRLHNFAGKIFSVAMLGIFSTALIIVFYSFNLFLLLVAIFSVYLALSGYLIAKNRGPHATGLQKLLSGTAALIAVAKLAVGLSLSLQGNGLGYVLLSFGAIMGLLSAEEIRHWVAQDLRGNLRIALHLSRMLGGTIAILTASTVVNLEFEPEWLRWLLPTIIVTPLIIGWNLRLRAAPVSSV